MNIFVRHNFRGKLSEKQLNFEQKIGRNLIIRIDAGWHVLG